MICTQLRPGHLSVHVGDSLQCSEEIVKNLKLRLSMRSLLLLLLLLLLKVDHYYYYCCCCCCYYYYYYYYYFYYYYYYYYLLLLLLLLKVDVTWRHYRCIFCMMDNVSEILQHHTNKCISVKRRYVTDMESEKHMQSLTRGMQRTAACMLVCKHVSKRVFRGL